MLRLYSRITTLLAVFMLISGLNSTVALVQAVASADVGSSHEEQPVDALNSVDSRIESGSASMEASPSRGDEVDSPDEGGAGGAGDASEDTSESQELSFEEHLKQFREEEKAKQGNAQKVFSDTVAEPYSGESRSVYVVPITEVINKANYFILKRSIKEAIANNVDTLLLDIDTPGGSLGYCLEMMQALDNFEGQTIAFVNPDAISAGAFISMVTDEIYFAPAGTMGAAAVITGDGSEVPETMLNKIMSYMNAKMRAYTHDHPYRADVMRAMSEPDAEVEIEGRVIKREEDRLLTVTAFDAVELYGEPARPLLARGIAKDVEAVLDDLYGQGNYTITHFEISWAENAAKFFEQVMPVVLTLGVLLLLVELKTPSFGLIGGLGIGMIIIAILSNYVAGLAGLELVVLLLIGFALIVADIFLLPGTFVFGFIGISLILFTITWSMVDAWPRNSGGLPTFDYKDLLDAFTTVALSSLVSVAIFAAIIRFLPGSPMFKRFVLTASSASPDAVTAGGGSALSGASTLPDVGSRGVVTKALHPAGEVEVGGLRYNATVANGLLDKGERITVIGYRNFAILVDRDNAHST